LKVPLMIAVAFLASCAAERSAQSSKVACAPPRGFVDEPPPTIAAEERLISHTEEVIINRPLAVVQISAASTPLEQAIDRSTSLPGVSGTHKLTSGPFGVPGSRRITCLTDNSTLVEQVLESTQTQNTGRFRYVVWNYTSPQMRSVQYAIGYFERTKLP
jgi:hypothetical protein